jgi:hypothetical protein
VLKPALRIDYWLFSLVLCSTVFSVDYAYSHHVLGRPAYSLSEDTTTPPSMAVEAQIGDYFVTYMVFPAFPKPGEAGRVNLYASRISDGAVFDGEVSFYVRDDSLFSDAQELLGVQVIDDGVYRQGYVISDTGSYIVRAEFEENGEPYVIDFPLQIGEKSALGPLGIAVGIVVAALLGVNFISRKRLIRTKMQNAHS